MTFRAQLAAGFLAALSAHATEKKAEKPVAEKPPATTSGAEAVAAEVAVSTANLASSEKAVESSSPAAAEKESAALCEAIAKMYRKHSWGEPGCKGVAFTIFGRSSQGRPLLAYAAGDDDPKAVEKLTVIQCGIHGDELTSLPMCLRLIQEIESGKRLVPKGRRLIVHPLLNPDGMFADKPSRANAHGVDINRNFPAHNWAQEALQSWKSRDRADPRKFPGEKPNSESETQALVDFIKREKPQKIISIHTPLGFLDLDTKTKGEHQDRRAKFLAINMVKNSGNYKFRDYGVFPGSLGNFAGRELGIPVYTLELPGGDKPQTLENYWTRFRPGLWRAIDFDLDTGQFVED